MPSSASVPIAPGEHRLGNLVIFDTHPIQYRSPVFRALSQRLPGTKVYYFSKKFDGSKWWFHEVGKIPAQAWDVDLKSGFDSEVLHTEGKTWASNTKRLREVLLRDKPDAVLIYGYYLPEHWILRRLCAKLNLPLIFVGESFSTGSSPLRRFLKKPLMSYFLSGIHQFIAIGDKTEAHYQTLGIPKEKITTGKYCVDVSFFQMDEGERQQARKKWREENRIPPEAFVVLFVGRLFERKRPWDVFAVHSAAQDGEKIYTVMAGTGPQEALLQQEAKLHPQMRFLGFQNQTEIRNAYQGADLLLVPSQYETWGLVTNEAFAAGMPAIVTDTCGSAHDLVVENETGFVVPVGDTAAMAEKIRHLANAPDDFKRLSENAKNKVETQYSIEGFAESILTGFKQGIK